MKGVFGVMKTPPSCSSIAFKLRCYECPALTPVLHDVVVESGFCPCVLVSHGGRHRTRKSVMSCSSRSVFGADAMCLAVKQKQKQPDVMVFFFSLPLSVVIKLYLLIVVFSRKN